MKGPLSYYLYALALGIFGHGAMGVRLLDVAAVLVCSWYSRQLVLKLTGGARFGANCAVVFFALTYYGGGFWNTAQPEAWAGVLILMAIAALLRSESLQPRALAACGTLIALATLIKPSFVAFMALPALHLLTEPTTWLRRGWLLTVCSLVWAAVVIAGMGLLGLASGGLSDFADVLRFIFLSHSSVEHRHLLTDLARQPLSLARIGVLVPLLLVPIGTVLLRRKGLPREATLLAAWSVLGILVVVAQGKYWTYHWIPAVIAISVLLGVTLASFDNPQSAALPRFFQTRAALLASLALILGPAALRAVFHSYWWPGYVVGIEARDRYESHFATPTNEWRYPCFEALATYITTHSQPTDRVLVWGWDPLINVLAGRRSPSRFGFSYPLTAPGPLQKQYRQVFLQEITSSPPRYIVVDGSPSWSVVNRAGLDLLRDFPQLDRLLHSHYKLATSVQTFQVWERTG